MTKDDTSVADSDEKGEKLSNNIAGDAASVEQQNYGPPPSWRSRGESPPGISDAFSPSGWHAR